MENSIRLLSIWFDDYKDNRSSMEGFKKKLVEEGFMDYNYFFKDKAIDTFVVVDNKGVHLFYKSSPQKTFNLNQFQDWTELEDGLQ